MFLFKNALLSIIRASAEQGPERGAYDSVQDELHFLQKNLLGELGVNRALNSRKDIDELVSSMLTRFNL